LLTFWNRLLNPGDVGERWRLPYRRHITLTLILSRQGENKSGSQRQYNRTSALMGGGTVESSFQHPAIDIALPVEVQSRGDYGVVGLEPHRVTVACGDHLRSKVGGDRVVAAHGDGGGGIINSGNGADVATPVDKLISFLSLGHQVAHCSLIVGKSPLSRGGY